MLPMTVEKTEAEYQHCKLIYINYKQKKAVMGFLFKFIAILFYKNVFTFKPISCIIDDSTFLYMRKNKNEKNEKYEKERYLLMKNMKKLVLMLLVCAMVFSPLISCSNKPADDGTPTDGAESGGADANENASAEESTTDQYAVTDNLPSDLDFGGETIRVWLREVDTVFYTNEWEFTEEIKGEIFNDRLYERELKVEERLNVNIEKTMMITPFQKALKSIKADDDEFDMICDNAYDLASQALEGIYVDLANFPYIDYSMPWWPDTIIKDVTINNRMYSVTGDITPSVLGFMNCIFFNKNIAANYEISGLYDLVFSGKWTFDKYSEFAKQVYKDVNGDGVPDKEDLFGVTTSDYYDVYFSAFEIPMTTTNADGSLSLALGEKFYEAYNRLREFSMDISSLPQVISNNNEAVNYSNDVEFFANGQLLFFGGLLRFSEYYRAMEADYGILTVPKWDEHQEGYHTTSHANYSLLSVPITVPQERRNTIGAVIEALASEGYRTVTPAYFDTTLKDKYSRDEETLKVLDILRNGLEFQPVMIYYKSMGDMLHLFRYACYPQNTYDNMVSYYEKNVPKFEKAINKFNEYYLNVSE